MVDETPGEPEELEPEEVHAPPERTPWWRSWAVIGVIVIVVVAAATGTFFLLQPGGPATSSPVAVGFASTTTTSPGTSITFDATASWDLDGNVTGYAWDFGDGSQASGATTTHSYQRHGSYITTLTVTDDLGATANNDVYLIRIQALPATPSQSVLSRPVAVIQTDGNARAAGSTVSFDGTSSWQWTDVSGTLVGLNVAALSYSWDFDGDGDADSTEAMPTWTYANPGNYPVRLTVTSSSSGLSSTGINTIRILQPEPAFAGTVPNPDVYTHVMPNELSFLDPAHDYAWPGFNNLFTNVYEHLISYDRDDPNTLIPVLAEQIPTVANGGVSPDGLTYTFKIRQGVPFQCGGVLTAEDVAYSFNRHMVMNLPDGPAWELLEALTPGSVVATDQSTVEFTLFRPFAPFLKLITFGNFGVISKDFVIDNGGWDPSVPGNDLPYDGGNNASGWGGRTDPGLEADMCGTGPYGLRDWQRGLSITLERFDDYWRGPAAIPTVVIQLSSEFNDRLLALQGGEADASYLASNLDQVNAVRALRADGFRIVSGNPTFQETAKIHLNQQIDLSGVPPTDNVPADFFQDINVRLAFNYAVNRGQIIESARAGQGIVSRGPIPPSAFGFNPDVPTYDLDAAKVEAHLRLAMAPDGMSWWDKGFRLTGLGISGFSAYTAMLLNLKDNLESINPRIQIDVQELDLPAFFTKWVTFGYAIMATTMYPEYGDPHTWLGLEATSFGFISKFMGVPATLDPLVAQSLEATDPSDRAALIQQIQQRLYELAWYVWVDYTVALDASQPWVNGYYYHPLRAHPPYYALSK